MGAFGCGRRRRCNKAAPDGFGSGGRRSRVSCCGSSSCWPARCSTPRRNRENLALRLSSRGRAVHLWAPMTARPYVLEEVTWPTVTTARYDVAVLPWGATEAHNRHLPYGTDTIEARSIGIEAARRAWERAAKVAALPAVPFGGHTARPPIPLSLTLTPSTPLPLS